MAAILVSGCTLPGGSVTGGKGIIIESFEPDFPQIYSTESVQLSLKIRNAGTVDGIVNDVQLTGVDWTKDGAGTCESMKGKLLPAVPDKGITGETKNCIWVAKPKQNDVPNGLSVTFYPVARVIYSYTTSTVKSVTLGTSSELRSIQDRGGTLPADTVSTTSGPVAIDIVSKGPIRVSQSGVEFPIEVKISNAGGGIACKSGSCGSADWNKVNLVIKTGSALSKVDSCEDREYTLWRGRENTIGCKLRVSGSNLKDRMQELITVTATYGYIVDATTSVTVTGQTPSEGGAV